MQYLRQILQHSDQKPRLDRAALELATIQFPDLDFEPVLDRLNELASQVGDRLDVYKRQHVFVAGKDLDLVDATGTECAVSEGDALQLTGPPAADATAANLVVMASKGGNECRRGVTVAVNLSLIHI